MFPVVKTRSLNCPRILFHRLIGEALLSLWKIIFLMKAMYQKGYTGRRRCKSEIRNKSLAHMFSVHRWMDSNATHYVYFHIGKNFIMFIFIVILRHGDQSTPTSQHLYFPNFALFFPSFSKPVCSCNYKSVCFAFF